MSKQTSKPKPSPVEHPHGINEQMDVLWKELGRHLFEMHAARVDGQTDPASFYRQLSLMKKTVDQGLSNKPHIAVI